MAFIDHWNQAAASILAIKAESLEGTEEILYPGKSSKNCDALDIESEVELAAVHSAAGEEREGSDNSQEQSYDANDISSSSGQETSDSEVHDGNGGESKRGFATRSKDSDSRKRRRLV